MNSERTTINLVIAFLGLAILFGMGIGGYLAIFDKGVPDFIVATTSGAIGALGAMLAKTSSGSLPVVVNNAADDPVPVAEAPKRARGAKGAVDLITALVAVFLVVAILLLLSGGDFRF